MSGQGERKPVKRRRKSEPAGEDSLVKVDKVQPPTPRDPSGKWRKKCDGLANDLGWPRQFIWDHFDQLALCCEYEQKIERWLAEHAGFRLLRGMFEKAGLGAGDCN